MITACINGAVCGIWFGWVRRRRWATQWGPGRAFGFEILSEVREYDDEHTGRCGMSGRAAVIERPANPRAPPRSPRTTTHSRAKNNAFTHYAKPVIQRYEAGLLLGANPITRCAREGRVVRGPHCNETPPAGCDRARLIIEKGRDVRDASMRCAASSCLLS